MNNKKLLILMAIVTILMVGTQEVYNYFNKPKTHKHVYVNLPPSAKDINSLLMEWNGNMYANGKDTAKKINAVSVMNDGDMNLIQSRIAGTGSSRVDDNLFISIANQLRR